MIVVTYIIRCGRYVARIILIGGYYVARTTHPEFVPEPEYLRYQKWLRDHAPEDEPTYDDVMDAQAFIARQGF